ISTFLPITSRGLISVLPHPFYQPCFTPGTACSGEYTVRFDQSAPMAMISAESPNPVVSQPVVDGTHACANSFIPMDKTDADQTKPEPWCQDNRVRRSNRAVAMTRNGQVEHATLKLNLDLPCPLSKLANGTPHIPVRDMCAWVDRPVETRHQEALQRHGKIPRPMNSFMLYRLAYSDRAKYWLAHDDHQAISILTGRSWKMEPP
ncbi:hypothetical protein ASPFODRAFT_109430, partial [Aspergillus luchuensis CBS 106.47]